MMCFMLLQNHPHKAIFHNPILYSNPLQVRTERFLRKDLPTNYFTKLYNPGTLFPLNYLLFSLGIRNFQEHLSILKNNGLLSKWKSIKKFLLVWICPCFSFVDLDGFQSNEIELTTISCSPHKKGKP